MIKNKQFILLFLPFLLASCSYNSTKSYSVNDYKIKMNYKDNFKIMQLTDLHFSVQSDYVTVTNYLKKNIETCNPDLMIITGDTFMSASRNIVDNVLNFIDSFNIPFAFTYGNHDFQGNYDFYYINNSLFKLKNALVKDYIDDSIFGYSNYFIDLMDNAEVKYRLYIIDSNSYYFNGLRYQYDIIHDDQIAHLEQIYKEDGAAPSFAFYHIPLYEVSVAYNDVKAGKIVDYKGENNEKISFGYKRTDAFKRMKDIGVIGHFYGHDHINYTDILYDGVTLSYGLKSTPEIYDYDNYLGYKTITLKSNMAYDLTNIEMVRVPYEK